MNKQVINVTQRLADHAAATPDCPAMIVGGRRISFGEFDAATDAAAALLARQGVARGDVLRSDIVWRAGDVTGRQRG